jgi:hypothetical protein
VYTSQSHITATFAASWPELRDSERPGSNACQAALISDDSQVIDTSNFTATVGIGSVVEVDFPKVRFEAAEELSAKVACIPYTKEGHFPDATTQA